MSELWQGVLLGVVFSIPVGLIINIISPYITRRIDKRSARSTAKRADRDARFKAEAAKLAKDRPAMYTYLLETLIRVAYIGAIFGALSGAVFVIGQLTVNADLFSPILFSVGQLLALIGALIVLNIARGAVQMIREVRTAKP